MKVRQHKTASGIDAWIFDLDNTLVECLAYYDTARERVRSILREAGVPVSSAAFVHRLGVVRRPIFRSMGFGHLSFAKALRETYRELSEEAGIEATPEALAAAWGAGQSVFHADYTPYPGAIDTLRWLRASGARLALLTKGEEDEQQRKIDLHGLAPYFEHIEIVRWKTEREVDRVVRVLGTAPTRTMMVGDSLQDDIASAAKVGCQTVWVNADPICHPELHDGASMPEPDFVVDRVTELPLLAARLATRAALVSL
jgi:putative hydrolase of the HAD superfamily